MGTTQNVTYSCVPPTAKSYAELLEKAALFDSSIDKFESKICNAKTVLSGAACLSHKVVCSWGSDIFKEFDSYETASYVFTGIYFVKEIDLAENNTILIIPLKRANHRSD